LQLKNLESALQHSIEEVVANVAETELKEVDDKEEAIQNVLVNILKRDVVQGDVIEKASARISLKSIFRSQNSLIIVVRCSRTSE